MPGAGSSTVAFAEEDSYRDGVGTDPTYYGLGTNVQVQTAELSRNLLEILAPGDVEAQEFLAQNMGGQLGMSFILKNDDFHRLILNDNFTGVTSGLANSAEVYLGVDYNGGVTERQIKGFAPATCQIQYQGSTSAVRVTITGAYGDEEQNTSVTPGTVGRAGSEVPGHGTELTVDGTAHGERLQSATIQLSQISRLITGASVKPIEAVAGNVQESIDVNKYYNGPEFYKLALGGSTANSVETDVDSVPGSLTFSADGSEVASYDFSKIAPETYDWQDLVNNDADLNDVVNFRATGLTASDPTA